jgi:hypothetical protein
VRVACGHLFDDLVSGCRQDPVSEMCVCVLRTRVIQGIPLKAFGNWRAKFKAEPQPPARKLLYRRGGLSHALSHSLSHSLGHMTCGSPARAAVGGQRNPLSDHKDKIVDFCHLEQIPVDSLRA